MVKISAGILVYRKSDSEIEVLLGHPGGPFWKNKDEGSWSIPKGLAEDGEDFFLSALREFEEETSVKLDSSKEFTPLSDVKLKSGKIVKAWSVEGDFDVESMLSNTFEMIWPPKSGITSKFPEIDRMEYFKLPMAFLKISPPQKAFFKELLLQLKIDFKEPEEPHQGGLF